MNWSAQQSMRHEQDDALRAGSSSAACGTSANPGAHSAGGPTSPARPRLSAPPNAWSGESRWAAPGEGHLTLAGCPVGQPLSSMPAVGPAQASRSPELGAALANLGAFLDANRENILRSHACTRLLNGLQTNAPGSAQEWKQAVAEAVGRPAAAPGGISASGWGDAALCTWTGECTPINCSAPAYCWDVGEQLEEIVGDRCACIDPRKGDWVFWALVALVAAAIAAAAVKTLNPKLAAAGVATPTLFILDRLRVGPPPREPIPYGKAPLEPGWKREPGY
jgi:hypothetical protein